MADEEFGRLQLEVEYSPPGAPLMIAQSMRFLSEPPDRMLFHPDAITSMDPAYGVLNNDGTLVLTATNGTATYQHTDAHQGCLVFERVSWEPK